MKWEGYGNTQIINDAYQDVVLPNLRSCWVFGTMEAIGDASEDPFERSMNDVPMNALCRTIERDLRPMLDEPDLPEPEQASRSVMY